MGIPIGYHNNWIPAIGKKIQLLGIPMTMEPPKVRPYGNDAAALLRRCCRLVKNRKSRWVDFCHVEDVSNRKTDFSGLSSGKRATGHELVQQPGGNAFDAGGTAWSPGDFWHGRARGLPFGIAGIEVVSNVPLKHTIVV